MGTSGGRAAGSDRLREWLLQEHRGRAEITGPHGRPRPEARTHRWWQVMCLSGVDYFSTLGYQPGIAALAAGALSPLATLLIVLLTLAGALPIYRRVAVESPHGEGSIAMLERLLSWWAGKLLVLVLLGFVATDFMITITLSTADAAAHVIENPFARHLLDGRQMAVTLIFISGLAVVFLRGFAAAIGIAVGLVGTYLTLNAVVIAVAIWHSLAEPVAVDSWWRTLTTAHASPLAMIGVALLVFPRLALGLSGFETGVVVMPQIRSGPGDTERQPVGRIRGTHRLLTAAAATMSVFLIASSFTTVVLIPPAEFADGGRANGRALAYLAHEYLGDVFGTLYDLSTIAILGFAGASAMAGLLNIVPRYLPRYGMAPEWARAARPLVLVYTAIAVAITIIFDAGVDAQAGAYATGVLVLILSASFAATLAARHRGHRRAAAGYSAITLIFAYTTMANILKRPDGVKIASIFIAGIVAVSLASRVRRSFELRATQVDLDPLAARFVDEAAAAGGTLSLIANEPDRRDEAEYRDKLGEQHRTGHIPERDPVLFLEVTLADTSEFTTALSVTGEERFGYRILRVRSPVVANTVAAVLLTIRNRTGGVPHVYFNWSEGNPLLYFTRYLIFGVGEVATVTREVLRRAEADPVRRPTVHVS